MSVDMVEIQEKASEPVRTAGVLQQNRVFLDFFWDLAKPDQEVRISAVENLLKYLKDNNKEDELEYTVKRLVDGLAHTREAARPGFSLALGQLLNAFEDLTLQNILDRIKEKYNVQKAPKKFIRNAAFGSLFGVLALHQSGRLFNEPLAVLGCVQLLQDLTQQRQHLKDLPSKTMMDILTEVPEKVFEEVLLTALQSDLASAFQTPEQLRLLLVALERFPHTLEPKKLKKLLGSSTIITNDNIEKLTHILKLAAHAVKKECVLPPVALDLLKLSLREDSFQLFWNKAITEGMLKESWGPTHFLSFRLLGRALPFLSLSQLKEVLSGKVMIHYGEHVVSAQKQERFKLAPEMETYVSDFLEGCEDAEKQLAVMVSFSSLVNQGYPVVPSVWRVVRHLRPAVLQDYVAWLRTSFLRPRVNEMLNFTSRKQKEREDEMENSEQEFVFRLRKWIVARLASIVDNNQVKKDEELIMEIARFVFFHAFFTTKKICAAIPETEDELHVPLDGKTRAVLVGSFFGLLLSMHNLPQADEASKGELTSHKRTLGVTSDGSLWLYRVVEYAQELLRTHTFVSSVNPFNADQRLAWESMLESVASLQKKAKKGHSVESSSFQQLFLLVGMHLFKAPDELAGVMQDLQSCVEKAQEKKAKKKKKKASKQEEAEPEWVEVLVDILLSLLSQPSRQIRQVCKTVFASVCPHVNAAALTAIMDVLDPDKEGEEDGPVLVEDDAEKSQKKTEEDDDEEMEEESDKSGDDSEDDNNEEAMEEEVDQNFKLELLKVLQPKKTKATEEEASDDDLSDDAMMEQDKSLAIHFAEQKKKIQATKDAKDKIRKEKMLVRDFKIKVLDLVEVFVTRQAGSPLVLDLLEPLLYMIERGMRSGNEQQEQDFLRRAADIFRNQLCRSKVYCKTAEDRQEELHNLLDKLMTKTQKLSESSVGLYYFSAALYVVKVLRGATSAENKDEQATSKTGVDLRFMGNVDVERVAGVFREALHSFMSRRKSPLTTQMFTDLFNRFPVLCVNLLDATVPHITSGVREHQQAQACILVLRAMQNRDVQQLMSGAPWLEFCTKVAAQLAAALKLEGQTESKALREKVVKALELCQFLVKHVHQRKLSVELVDLKKVLQVMTEVIAFKNSGTLEDTYWAVMKHFGVMKPKVEKTKPDKDAGQPPMPQQAAKKQKGFLPESKKRKKRPQPVLEPAAAAANSAPMANKAGVEKGQGKKKNKKKTKRAADVEAAQAGPAKKKMKMPAESKLVKKKKKKNKQKKEGGGQV
ncbi:myb-binding protein 1A-like protein [Corythoichthys intestinalis]|uniref:myb-binding protein 1A-like protein n=1 Tax=Corythoichthys intestinalis TaxID=161448 RepID=UPI0025A53CA0|nr:myb-binding protein 1A-like protein [Corythoichthys intestinalis]XP_061801720.1 myb-binding protein 1A-like protein [Nerophis lumbriciformis]